MEKIIVEKIIGNKYIIENIKTKELHTYTETKELNLRHWMINHLDQSDKYEVYKKTTGVMHALEMIKRLSEYQSETFKKVLCMGFLEDINYHKESEEIYKTFQKKSDFMEGLYILSRKNSYTKDTWDYLNEKVKYDKYQKGLDELMTKIWNFRVATDPDNSYNLCGYDAFRAYGKALSLYSAITYVHWGVIDWEAEEIIKFALAPNED